MRTFLLTATMLLLSLFSKSQTPQIDSLKLYLTFHKDQFTDHVDLQPIDTIRGKSKLGSLYVINMDSWTKWNEFKFTIGCAQLGCVDGNSSINFVLSDGSKVTATNDLIFNCFGIYTFQWIKGQGKYKLLENLTRKPIKMMRLNGRVTSDEITLTDEQSFTLYNQLKWMKYYYDNQSKVNKMKPY